MQNNNSHLVDISIHAPHEGERPAEDNGNDVQADISIHAPHEGERLDKDTLFMAAEEFQSTLPTRGSDTASKSKRPSV